MHMYIENFLLNNNGKLINAFTYLVDSFSGANKNEVV